MAHPRPGLAASVLIIGLLFWNSTLRELEAFDASTGADPFELRYLFWFFLFLSLFSLGILFISQVRGTFYRTGAYWTLAYAGFASLVGASILISDFATGGSYGADNALELYGYVSWLSAGSLLAIILFQLILLFSIFLWMLLAAPVSLFSQRAASYVRTTLLGLGIVALQWNLWIVFVSPFRLNSGVEGSVDIDRSALNASLQELANNQQELGLIWKAVENGSENRVEALMNASYAELMIFLIVILLVFLTRSLVWMLRPVMSGLPAPRVLFNGLSVVALVASKFLAATIFFFVLLAGVFVHLNALNYNVAQVFIEQGDEVTCVSPPIRAGVARDQAEYAVQLKFSYIDDPQNRNPAKDLKAEHCYLNAVFGGDLEIQLFGEEEGRVGPIFEMFGPLYSAFIELSRNYIGFAVALLVPLAAMFFMRPIGYAASVLEDINNYNCDERTPRRLWWRWLPDRKLFQRRRVAARYRATLHHMLDQESIRRLLIVSHSQGTVITYDFAQEMAQACAQRGVQLDIITMGSPLKHIYQHYFVEYEDVDGEINALGGGVASWRNYYCYDDPIGTTLNEDGATQVQDIDLGRGGHFKYWTNAAISGAVQEAMTS